MSLGTVVGLGPGDIVLDRPWGPSFPSRPKWALQPLFLAHVYCDHTAGWIRISLGTEVGLSPGDVVLDGDQATPHEKGHSSPPQLSAHFTLACMVVHLSCC